MALPDLAIRSVLDVVLENYSRLGLKAFACRIVYAGDHTLGRGELVQMFRNTVDAANSLYCDVALSGFLLVYEGYFIHVLEGSEDTINRQLRFLLKSAHDYKTMSHNQEAENNETDDGEKAEVTQKKDVFGRMKLLIVYHSIEEKTLAGWGALTATPPTLVTKLEMYSPIEYHMEQLSLCLSNMQKLCDMYVEDKELTLEGLSAVDPRMQILPAFVLLELLLDSKYVVDLMTYINYHRRVDDYTFYFERVWPLPTHYTPRHLYKLKVDEEFVLPLPTQEWQRRSPQPDTDAEPNSEESSD